MKLVVVESPAKCSKIAGFLGAGYRVQATCGHIRALEEDLKAVGIDRDWTPTYAEIEKKRDAIAALRSAARGVEEVILATDDDREGEGIAWHVCFVLKLNPATTQRIVFHEITKPALLAAVARPRNLDLHKVNAQQARAMLDMLVGFTISTVLRCRVAPSLSAGRCQTPALRLVVERDTEVENHSASAYWRLNGTVTTGEGAVLEVQAAEDLPSADTARTVLQTLSPNDSVTVVRVAESVSTSAPPKPFITSTLQQEASSSHGLSPQVTMAAAQKLYEAGHITYMRTDNPVLSAEAAAEIRAWVVANHGAVFVGVEGQHTMVAAVTATTAPTTTEKKGGKKSTKAKEPAPVEAQAAHEAIRPTHPEAVEPAIEDATQRTVYKLIWRRAVQSQMAAATTDVRKAILRFEAEPTRVWNAEQTKVAFAGWRALERVDAAKIAADAAAWDTWKPVLVAGSPLKWTTLKADEHFTKPRGRFTEASLIAELEKRGIGRPSTFASLVGTILEREYVEKTNVEGTTQDSHHLSMRPLQWPPTETTQAHKVGAEKNKLRSTALGRTVAAYLTREYGDLFNYDFTAAMEGDLDSIAKGAKPWKSLLQSTWDTYKERFATHTAGGAAASKAARERVLAEGLKIALTRKGPLFIREPVTAGGKASFAAVPAALEFEAATAADAEAAFGAVAATRLGECVGSLGDDPIYKKKGPYGFYAECCGTRVPLKGGETLEVIQERLTAKQKSTASGEATFERKVGDFTIKRGPYGFYFFKHALKRAVFVKLPETVDAATVTAADLTKHYSAGIAAKRKAPAAKKTSAPPLKPAGGAGATDD